MDNEAGVKVVNGEIIVIDGSNKEQVTIKAQKNINLFINDKVCEIYKEYEVSSNDKITYNCEKTKANRQVNVIISEKKHALRYEK